MNPLWGASLSLPTGRPSPGSGLTGRSTLPPPCPGNTGREISPCFGMRRGGWMCISAAGSRISRRPSPRRARNFKKRCGRSCSPSPTGRPGPTGSSPGRWRSAGGGSAFLPRRWGAPWGETPSPFSSPATGWWGRQSHRLRGRAGQEAPAFAPGGRGHGKDVYTEKKKRTSVKSSSSAVYAVFRPSRSRQ